MSVQSHVHITTGQEMNDILKLSLKILGLQTPYQVVKIVGDVFSRFETAHQTDMWRYIIIVFFYCCILLLLFLIG